MSETKGGAAEGAGAGKKTASLCWSIGCLGVIVLGIAAVQGPKLISARTHGNETAAIGALKTIGTAQTLYRESREEQVYGGLSRLLEAERIDEVVASGTKSGYRFDCAPSTTTPEFLWWATANPVLPGSTGHRYFATNHEGVIYYTTEAPLEVDPKTAAIAENAIPVGR